VEKRSIPSMALAVLVCAALAACRKPVDCKFKHRVEKDTTLVKACSPYTIKGGIDVLHDATLTIEAGVELRFRNTDWLEIAAAGTRGGKLVARGTREEPIVLTAQDGQAVPARPARTWLGLWFNAGTGTGSILSNAIIRSGGGDNRHIKPTLTQGCITLTDVAEGAVTIENVRVEGCANAGVVLQRSQASITGLTIVDTRVGFQLDGVAADAIPAAVTYDRVDQHLIERAAGGPRRGAEK
jgi:hypothetical protein